MFVKIVTLHRFVYRRCILVLQAGRNPYLPFSSDTMCPRSLIYCYTVSIQWNLDFLTFWTNSMGWLLWNCESGSDFKKLKPMSRSDRFDKDMIFVKKKIYSQSSFVFLRWCWWNIWTLWRLLKGEIIMDLIQVDNVQTIFHITCMFIY